MEILLPRPKSAEWAAEVSRLFGEYFTSLAAAKSEFVSRLEADGLKYIASALSGIQPERDREAEGQNSSAE